MTFDEVLVKRSVPSGHTHEQLSSVFGSPARDTDYVEYATNCFQDDTKCVEDASRRYKCVQDATECAQDGHTHEQLSSVLGSPAV